MKQKVDLKLEIATFGGGCFWCTEAIFKRLRGVLRVVSGYSGGETENPDYKAVSRGTTGHAESVQVEFDPKSITYEKLLEVFFRLHDPTTLNRQGEDVGEQYRSVIFYHSDEQKKLAEKVVTGLKRSGMYKNPIVTLILPFEKFYEAEKYHQNYYENNRLNSYCQLVIDPKITKLYKDFGEIVKKG